MNIKTIIASSLLTLLCVGQTAFAGDNDRFPEATFATTTESVVIQTVSYQAPTVYAEDNLLSGKK